MIILNYVNFENKEGIVVENAIIPTDIPKETICQISPMITSHGAFYKNVTILKDIYGEQYRVVGNYKHWIDRIRNKQNKIGFK